MTARREHRIATTEELSDDGSTVIEEIGGHEICVYRIDGEYYAVANFCPHQGAPLCEGELDGRMVPGDDGWEWQYDDEEKIVACPWHAWRFEVTTGKNVHDDRYAVPTYDVVVRDGDIFVRR